MVASSSEYQQSAGRHRNRQALKHCVTLTFDLLEPVATVTAGCFKVIPGTKFGGLFRICLAEADGAPFRGLVLQLDMFSCPPIFNASTLTFDQGSSRSSCLLN